MHAKHARRSARPQVYRRLAIITCIGLAVVILAAIFHPLANGRNGGAGDQRPDALTATTTPTAVPSAAAVSKAESRRSRHPRHHRSAASPSPSTPSSGSGCVADPQACGFPDSTNSGVPSNVALTAVPAQTTHGQGWTWDSDHIVVTTNGATLSGLNVNGWIEIDANDVTLDDLNVTNTGDWWGIGLYCQDQTQKGCVDAKIENTTVGSPAATGANRLEVGIKDVYGDAVGTQIIRANIYHASTGIQISNGTIEDSYIHDFGYNSSEGDHLNGISVGGGDPRPLLIQHNTVLNNYGQTDAIALFQDFGPEVNKTISDNLLAGGGYAFYGGGPNGCTGPATAFKCNPSSNIIVTNNVFSTMFFQNGGVFGPVANFNPAGSGNVWSGNTWTNGRPVGPSG
jgi:hypothetical protein